MTQDWRALQGWGCAGGISPHYGNDGAKSFSFAHDGKGEEGLNGVRSPHVISWDGGRGLAAPLGAYRPPEILKQIGAHWLRTQAQTPPLRQLVPASGLVAFCESAEAQPRCMLPCTETSDATCSVAVQKGRRGEGGGGLVLHIFSDHVDLVNLLDLDLPNYCAIASSRRFRSSQQRLNFSPETSPFAQSRASLRSQSRRRIRPLVCCRTPFGCVAL